MILKLAHPLLHLLKAFSRSDLINHNSSYGLSIVDWSDGIVFFLTGRILDTIVYTQMASLTT